MSRITVGAFRSVFEPGAIVLHVDETCAAPATPPSR
jgi:hypothetical protein